MTRTALRRRSRAHTAGSRRGAAALAGVILLVFAQLIIVGAVIAGSREQDMTRVRLETTRAFYATEAGCNMAIREAISGIDEDHDGAIGTISNDNNTNNDPTLAAAQVSVSRSAASGLTALVSNGRSGQAKRKADVRMQGVIGGLPQTVMTGFGRGGNNQPRYSVWNGSTWSTSQALTALGAEAKWVRMKICPTRNETSMIIESVNDNVNVMFYNGSTWSAPYLVSTDTGGTNDRPEDVGYEQLSSNALCVYWKGTVSKFGYRVYNGTGFGAEQLLTSPFTTECDFLTLFPRPSTNEIVMLCADGIAGSSLQANVWNGSTFGGWTTMVLALDNNNQECYSMGFESQTGRGVAVYTELLTAAPRYRTLTGTTWSAQAAMPSIGGVAKWIRIAADPTSNKLLFAAQDDQGDLNVNVWSGTAWGSNVEHDTAVPNYDRRQFDVLFERATGRALLVYVEGGQNVFRYRTWNGSAWSSEMSGPNLGSQPQIITLSRGFAADELFVACSDSNRKLHLVRWSGGVMGGDNAVENGLSGQVQYYSFAVPEPTVAPNPRVNSWSEVLPQ